MNVNINWKEENVIQINGGITTNVDVSVTENRKRKTFTKFDSVITCGEIIELYDEETDFIEKKNVKLLHFTCIFIDYYSIIDSC